MRKKERQFQQEKSQEVKTARRVWKKNKKENNDPKQRKLEDLLVVKKIVKESDCEGRSPLTRTVIDKNKVKIVSKEVVVEEINAFGESPRFLLLGTIHGSFTACSNSFPGIFVETDDVTVLEFLYKEVYGSGL